MKLEIATIAPVHGPAVPWSAFEKAMEPSQWAGRELAIR